MTVILAVIFTYLQVIEYLMHHLIYPMAYMVQHFSRHRISWIHVIIGTIFIIVSFYRYLNITSTCAYFGFEAASWYWHFVDVVWLFLFQYIHLGSCIKQKINKSFWGVVNGRTCALEH
jgi:heme/copper-type cytochrome/quinol oxidase subunit 3